MRIYAITDIHGYFTAVVKQRRNILKTKPDVVIIIGDIVHFGSINQVSAILKYLSFEDIPTFFIPGNCDPRELLNVDIIRTCRNIHEKNVEMNNFVIVGFGGSNITPFNTLIEFNENEIYDRLKSSIDASDYRDKKLILVTHVPPYGTKLDITFMHQHVGSKSVKRIIEEYQPLLSIHGHIHEAQGYDYIGRTLIINPGPASRGFYANIIIEEKDKIDFSIERVK